MYIKFKLTNKDRTDLLTDVKLEDLSDFIIFMLALFYDH